VTQRARTGFAPRLLGLAVVCGLVLAFAFPREVARPALAPGLFEQLASGVALIQGSTCDGRLREQGTGFLVGRDVLMTARHVVDPGALEAADVCRLRARVDGEWIAIAHVDWWTRRGDLGGRRADVATAVLAHPADPLAHVFSFRKSSPAIGAQLAMVGYPLGQGVALTQGHLYAKETVQAVPTLSVRLLGAEGASGAPIVDAAGNVAGILQSGLGGADVLGQQTAGLVEAIDLPSWWGGWKVAPSLCRVYPAAGLPGCAPPPASTAPASRDVTGAPFATAADRGAVAYGVRGCWLQETGDRWSAVNRGDAITAVSRTSLVASPRAYWVVLALDGGAPDSLVVGAKLVNPQGLTSGDRAFTITPGDPKGAATLDWSSAATRRGLAFADPWLGTSGQWQVRFSLPDGQGCDVAFTVG
jgi:V8-like Glu-specific endopeptidase